MSDQEEWGPWIENDGKGCPVPVGTWVQVMGLHGQTDEGRVTYLSFDPKTSQWLRRYIGDFDYIIRYRIRKPRGLLQLQELIRDLPIEVPA